MVSRYENAPVINNNNRLYTEILKDRGIKQVQQYGTRNIRFPTAEQLTELDIVAHAWKYGDRFYKLAHDFYGDSNLWWVIAFFNQQPTESGLEFGAIVYIPTPIERVLSIYGV